MTPYTDRYAAYVRAVGAPDPPGRNHGYIAWVGERWREWERLTGRQRPHTDADQAAFDAWLRGTLW